MLVYWRVICACLVHQKQLLRSHGGQLSHPATFGPFTWKQGEGVGAWIHTHIHQDCFYFLAGMVLENIERTLNKRSWCTKNLMLKFEAWKTQKKFALKTFLVQTIPSGLPEASPSDQACRVSFLHFLNPGTMSNLDLYNLKNRKYTFTYYVMIFVCIYIYTIETGLAKHFLWFYLSIFWLMHVHDFIVSNRAGFPSRLSWRGPRSRDLGSRDTRGRETRGRGNSLRHGDDARRRLDVPVLW